MLLNRSCCWTHSRKVCRLMSRPNHLKLKTSNFPELLLPSKLSKFACLLRNSLSLSLLLSRLFVGHFCHYTTTFNGFPSIVFVKSGQILLLFVLHFCNWLPNKNGSRNEDHAIDFIAQTDTSKRRKAFLKALPNAKLAAQSIRRLPKTANRQAASEPDRRRTN